MTMASRIAIMSDGQLMQVGTPSDIYDYPNSRFTAEFMGETNILPGIVTEDGSDHTIIHCSDIEQLVYLGHGISGPEDQDIWLSIRPEDINIYREQPQQEYNWSAGIVKEIAYLGSFGIFHIQLPSGKIIKSQVLSSYWEQSNIPMPTWEEKVYISWPDTQASPLTY